jgi:hypothetical protein
VEACHRDRQAFLDEVARWKTCWNMVDGQKPQTLLETLNVTNQSSNFNFRFRARHFYTASQ